MMISLCSICWLILNKPQADLCSGDTSIRGTQFPHSGGCLLNRGPTVVD